MSRSGVSSADEFLVVIACWWRVDVGNAMIVRTMERLVSLQCDMRSWYDSSSSLVSARTSRILQVCREGHLCAGSLSSRYVWYTVVQLMQTIIIDELGKKLEMLACLRAGQHDGRRRQADNDFGGWVKTTTIF